MALTDKQRNALIIAVADPIIGNAIADAIDQALQVNPSEITLPAGQVLVGNSSGVAQARAVSGDATMSSAGSLAIAANAVTPAKMSAAAQVNAVFLPLPALPAPNGSNQLNQDLGFFGVVAPLGSVEILAVQLWSNTATSGSDASNQYTFEVYNSTDGVSLSSTAVGTNGAELSARSFKSLTVDQNATLTVGKNLAIRTDILDDGSAGPTNLATADLHVLMFFKVLS